VLADGVEPEYDDRRVGDGAADAEDDRNYRDDS
jgi:hypothetical protein